MKYEIGNTIWDEIEDGTFCINKAAMLTFPKKLLVDMGATPVDSTCGKCGEREETELCPKCGAESYGNCPCKPKEEKIEQIKPGDICHTIEEKDWYHDIYFLSSKINELVNAFNKLNKD